MSDIDKLFIYIWICISVCTYKLHDPFTNYTIITCWSATYLCFKDTHSSNKETGRKISRKLLAVCYTLWILCFQNHFRFQNSEGLK